MVANETVGEARTILVVEDEPMLLLVAAETLRDSGYVVWEAGEGRTAMNLLEAHPEIGLLITDVKMPGMNGYQVAEAAIGRRPGLKVLLMTGYAQEPVPEKMAKAGVQMLHKPFDLDRLSMMANAIFDAEKRV
jgi:CheY-like chemotaxis protein